MIELKVKANNITINKYFFRVCMLISYLCNLLKKVRFHVTKTEDELHKIEVFRIVAYMNLVNFAR